MRTLYVPGLLALAAAACASPVGDSEDLELAPDAVEARELEVQRGRFFEVHQYGVGRSGIYPYDIYAEIYVAYQPDARGQETGMAFYYFINTGTTQAVLQGLAGVSCVNEAQNLGAPIDFVLSPDEERRFGLGCDRITHAAASFTIDN